MPTKELLRHIVNILSVHLSRFVSVAYLFEVGIQNLVCGCILGWWSVTYYFWITVTLTYICSRNRGSGPKS